MLQLIKAEKPSFYFIGVTTKQSSIMKVFPLWAKALGIEAQMVGIDIGIHAPVEEYRQVVQFFRDDPLSLGALVTTHKIDLYHAAKDLFDHLDPYALMFGELSSISKENGKLCGHAKDPITCGLAMDEFIPQNHWLNTNSEVAIMGAGGSALAISAYLAQEKFRDNIPKRIHLTNRSEPRLKEAERLLSSLRVPMSFHLCPNPKENDEIVLALPSGSLVVNATGLGKDRPGSPLTDKCIFPQNGLIWELNYRGTLEFMHQALRQKEDRSLHVEDGWTYFIHGWTQVIAEVFHIDISGERLQVCADIANNAVK